MRSMKARNRFGVAVCGLFVAAEVLPVVALAGDGWTIAQPYGRAYGRGQTTASSDPSPAYGASPNVSPLASPVASPSGLRRSEEVRLGNQERKEARREFLRQAAQDRIRAHFQRLVHRLQAAIDRLTRLANRIEQRIGVLAGAGVNVTQQQSLLAEARQHIQLARESLATAQTNFESILATEKPRAAFRTARTSVRETINHLRLAHRTLVRIITKIKGLRIGTLGSPSPSGSPVASASPGASPTASPGVSPPPEVSPSPEASPSPSPVI